MSDAFVGEIRMFGGDFAPIGWEFCDGQLLSVRDNKELYQVIGTTYGGDGVTGFNLPNLQARVPLHPGQGTDLSAYTLGQAAGNESVLLSQNQMAQHWHLFTLAVNATDAVISDPTGAYLGNSGNAQYAAEPTEEKFGGLAVSGTTGQGNPHPNLQPYLCLNFIIALQGILPSQ